MPLIPNVLGDESSVIAHFKEAGARFTLDDDGHAVKLFSGGNPAHSPADLQQIGELKHLEQLAMNGPQANNEEWGFLRELPALKSLTIWHCKTFDSLEPFNGLPIESLTVGGCMGLRNLNKDQPEKQRDAVVSLRDLPNLKRLNLYHSPVMPDDAHLAHVAEEFPLLEDLKLDFAAPRGTETNISPDGLRVLKKLPLRVLTLENVQSLTPAHMQALAEITSLEAVLIDARQGGVDTAMLSEAISTARPELEVAVAEEGSPSPPRRARK